MKEKKDKSKSAEFKLLTYEGYEVITRSVEPPKKIDKKLKHKLPESFGIDFSKVINQENEKKNEN